MIVSLEMSHYKYFASALLSSKDEVELLAGNSVVKIHKAMMARRLHAFKQKVWSPLLRRG